MQKRSMHDISKPLVIGNWKMNPETLREAHLLFSHVKKQSGALKMQAAVAPPFVFLGALARERGGKYLALAAQNVHTERSGTFTGEVSARMLKSIGVTYVIIGHSERRAMGETDETVAAKVKVVCKTNMTPVLCIGESERDAAGGYLGTVEHQLKSGLSALTKKQVASTIIAYEPVWAISGGSGKGKTATPTDVHEMKLFIQKVLADSYGRKTAEAITIIYGGSVNASNARSLLEEGMVDGFLTGGASLKAKEFNTILKIAHAH